MLGRPAKGVACYYRPPGFRDHHSRLTGFLEFWAAPDPSQCRHQQPKPDAHEICLILMSMSSFEFSCLGAGSKSGCHSKPRQFRCTAGSISAIRLDRFLKAPQVRSDAVWSRQPVWVPRAARRGTKKID